MSNSNILDHNKFFSQKSSPVLAFLVQAVHNALQHLLLPRIRRDEQPPQQIDHVGTLHGLLVQRSEKFVRHFFDLGRKLPRRASL